MALNVRGDGIIALSVRGDGVMALSVCGDGINEPMRLAINGHGCA